MAQETPAITEDAVVARFGSRKILGRLVLFAVMLLLVGQATLAWFALRGFETELKPQLNQKAIAVGESLVDQIGFAVDQIDIPARKLVGVEEFFSDVLALNQDIEYLALVSLDHEVLYVQGLPDSLMGSLQSSLPDVVTAGHETEFEGYIDLAFPVVSENDAGTLHVGVSVKYVRDRLSEILLEVLTIIIVTWLVTLEFIMFFVGMRVSGPLRCFESALEEGAHGNFTGRFMVRVRDEFGILFSRFNHLMSNLSQRYEDFSLEAQEIKNAQIDEKLAQKIQAIHDRIDKKFRSDHALELRVRTAAQIRVPLFLIFFAEELSRSFLPLLAAQYAPQDLGMSTELLIGLPITLFMGAAMLCALIGGGLAGRIGARRVFLIGAPPAVLGFLGVFLTQTYYDFVLWRVLSGIGFGFMFIAGQAWVAEHVTVQNRATGLSSFVGAVLVGMLCGPPLGAVIAAQIGFEATFLISAVIAAVSGLIVFYMLDDYVERKERPTPVILGIREWLILLTDARFVIVSFMISIPSRLMRGGILFFLVPLYLNELGNRQSVIGWIIMLYGLATVAATPLAARIADRFGNAEQLVPLGAGITGAGCFLVLLDPLFKDATVSTAVIVLLMGVGHGIMFSPALSMIKVVGEKHGDTVGQSLVISAFRWVEGAGLIFGPILAGALLVVVGYAKTILFIGCIIVACTAIYLAVLYGGRREAGRFREGGVLR